MSRLYFYWIKVISKLFFYFGFLTLFLFNQVSKFFYFFCFIILTLFLFNQVFKFLFFYLDVSTLFFIKLVFKVLILVFLDQSPLVSLFSDDLILFAEASVEQIEVIKESLRQFCDMSGQKLNFQKSNICFSSIVKERKV